MNSVDCFEEFRQVVGKPPVVPVAGEVFPFSLRAASIAFTDATFEVSSSQDRETR